MSKRKPGAVLVLAGLLYIRVIAALPTALLRVSPSATVKTLSQKIIFRAMANAENSSLGGLGGIFSKVKSRVIRESPMRG